MASYRVTFFKNLVNSSGHEFKCLQGTIEIRSARAHMRALRAAERRYKRSKQIHSWRLYADSAEMEALTNDGSSRIVLRAMT
jgi:hypothetical protein